MWNSLKDWLWHHQLLYPFILFTLAAVVSIYSQDIKSFLHRWPRTKEHARRAKENQLGNRIQLLRALHNDSYQLLLYLSRRVIHDCYAGIRFIAVLYVVCLLVKTHTKPGFYFYFLGGWLTGTLQLLNGVLRELDDFDATIVKLQLKLSELKREV